MNAVVMALLGAGIAVGLLLIRRAVSPRPSALDTVLGTLARPGRSISDRNADRSELVRAGAAARRVTEAIGYRPDRHRQELELVGWTPERHALSKVAGLIAGVIAPASVVVAVSAIGVSFPLAPTIALAIGAAVGGFVLPDAMLRDAAEKRRRAFRHALSSYLDLVNVLLAGGAGIETALHAAADAGDGWGYQTLRAELRRPYTIGGRELFVTTSVGVLVTGAHRTPSEALRDADLALYDAKSAGKDRVSLFHPGLRLARLDHARISAGLRSALARDEFVVHYQPILEVDSGSVVAVEP